MQAPQNSGDRFLCPLMHRLYEPFAVLQKLLTLRLSLSGLGWINNTLERRSRPDRGHVCAGLDISFSSACTPDNRDLGHALATMLLECVPAGPFGQKPDVQDLRPQNPAVASLLTHVNYLECFLTSHHLCGRPASLCQLRTGHD